MKVILNIPLYMDYISGRAPQRGFGVGSGSQTGPDDESTKKAEESLRNMEDGRDARDTELLAPLNELARLYMEDGRYQEAESLYRRSSYILEKGLGPDHGSVAPVLGHLGTACLEQGKYGEAEELFERALKSAEAALGPESLIVASSLERLGVAMTFQGKIPEAETLLKRSLQIAKKARGTNQPISPPP